MSLLKIARMGHPVLRRRAAEITDPTAPAVRQLALDMIETMDDAAGVGLAAPQVHVARRLIVFRVPIERQDPAEPDAPDGVTVLVNPVIEPLGDEVRAAFEGCLSIPTLRGMVPRYHRIHYSGFGLDGTPIECQAAGFHARVVQHEVDHLDGILYLDRMVDMTSLLFESEMHHLAESDEA